MAELKQIVDITGNRYGRLVVVQKAETKAKNREQKWICQCDCGNMREATGSALRRGTATSCGCGKVEKLREMKPTPPPPPPRKDLTGVRFGRLTAIRGTEKHASNGATLWECKCDCGGSTLTPIDCLTGGRTQSCGCLGEENKKRFPEKKSGELVDNTQLCMLTSAIRTDNTSGHKGVCWSKKDQRWMAYINIQKKRYNLGEFKDYEKAVKAREEAEAKYHKPILEKHGRTEDGNE